MSTFKKRFCKLIAEIPEDWNVIISTLDDDDCLDEIVREEAKNHKFKVVSWSTQGHASYIRDFLSEEMKNGEVAAWHEVTGLRNDFTDFIFCTKGNDGDVYKQICEEADDKAEEDQAED